MWKLTSASYMRCVCAFLSLSFFKPALANNNEDKIQLGKFTELTEAQLHEHGILWDLLEKKIMQEEKDWWKNNILVYASAIKILDRLISSSLCTPLYASMYFCGNHLCGLTLGW